MSNDSVECLWKTNRRGCQCILYIALGFRSFGWTPLPGDWSALAVTAKINTHPFSLFKKNDCRSCWTDLSEPRLTSSNLPHLDRVLAMALTGSYSQFVTCAIFLFNLYRVS